MAILTIQNVSFCYPDEAQPALQSIDLEIEEGEFVVLIGQSGCGKSTLLKQLKREIAPHGQLTGDILYREQHISALPAREAASEIGYVLQNPENQIVTDQVWHELAFGLENLGLDTLTIRRRVAEMANFFGIQTWFRSGTVGLSGGQKQLLNLASVMVMQPKVLLLDEPTSQLDPIAATEFIAMLRKLNEELGLTIVMIEHRLEEVLPIADRVIVMEQGTVLYDDKPSTLLDNLPNNHAMVHALPTAMRLFHQLDGHGVAPLTIRQGRRWLLEQEFDKVSLPDLKIVEQGELLLEAKDIAFRYDKNGQDILQNFELQVFAGQFVSIIGGNGTGKSTALKVLAGLLKPYRGQVFVKGKKLSKLSHHELYREWLAVLPQNPSVLFVEKLVRLELQTMAETVGATHDVASTIELFGLQDLLERHPYDLSGGEQQKLALAKLLLLKPRILLLDEPTKGLDAHAKIALSKTLQALQQQGVAIVMVTHDIEFSAQYSDLCALFFDGQIVSSGSPRVFYSSNHFYTTAAHRMSKHILDDAITCEDVVTLCKQKSV